MSAESNNAFVDPRFARSDEYEADLKEIAELGVCPLCPENFNWHKEPILNRQGDWLITRSSHPYQGTLHHFLIIGDQHKENFADLTEDDFRNIQLLVNWTVEEFNLPGGALCMRFGDTSHTGATVKHIHAHLIVPKVEKDTTTVVNFPIG